MKRKACFQCFASENLSGGIIDIEGNGIKNPANLQKNRVETVDEFFPPSDEGGGKRIAFDGGREKYSLIILSIPLSLCDISLVRGRMKIKHSELSQPLKKLDFLN